MQAYSSPVFLRHGPLGVYVKLLDGCAALKPLARSLPQPVVWLDSARPQPNTGRWSMLGFNPWLTFTAANGRLTIRTATSTKVSCQHPLEAFKALLGRYHCPPRPTPHSRAVGLMGVLSYELNRAIEPLPDPKRGCGQMPDMLWFAMQQVILVDHQDERSWLLSIADPHLPPTLGKRKAAEAIEQLENRLGQAADCAAVGGQSPQSGLVSLQATTTQAEFEAMVAQALAHIRAGDIFQANLSQRFTASFSGDSFALYERLRRINPSPFACWLSSEEISVVSASPERLVRVQEGVIDTRPIAGTRPRGTSAEADAVNSLELLLSDKERAEHIMLVDLARNDLGRVCQPGSVSVDELMTLESYSHVIHIVSDVRGQLCRGVDAVDVIRAVFPGGTITGCPKIRCMQILHALEPVARGLYTGSVGYIGFDGTMDLNIAIRTVVIQNRQLSFHAGAGIVADSVPEREYAETLAKAAAMQQAILQTAAKPDTEIAHELGTGSS